METIVLAGLGIAAICAILGLCVANTRYRDPVEGLLVGLIFGPLGVLVELLLPSGIDPSGRTRTPIHRSITDRIGEERHRAEPGPGLRQEPES